MGEELPTVRVKSADPEGTRINKTDYDPTIHQLFDAPDNEYTIAESKGKWYVMLDGKRQSTGFATEAEAAEELALLAAG